MQVREVMTREVAQHRIRRLPIVGNDQRLLGIVSLADVARTDQDSGGAALDHISELAPEPAY